MSKTVRLRRVSIENAYVSVPLVPDLIEPNFNDTGTIDTEKLMQAAIRLGH